jgi:uncharacterized protein (UPF0332 family)/predicted nucleotidyltransferase
MVEVQSKKKAVERFLSSLLVRESRNLIASVYLFGSLLRGNADEDSDIDILVVALREIDRVRDEAASAAFNTMLECRERLEPIVVSIEELREGRGYFFREVLKEKEEVYHMNEEELGKEEAKNFLLLAQEYLDGSRKAFSSASLRLSIDGAYNAAELCLKAFLRLKGREIPRRHGSIVSAFSEEYIKSGPLSRELGRKLSRSMETRNRSRYEYTFRVSKEDGEQILSLAENLYQLLQERL